MRAPQSPVRPRSGAPASPQAMPSQAAQAATSAPIPDAIVEARKRDQQALYLSRRGLGLSIAGASKAAGLDVDTVYEWRQDPEFKALCAEAHNKGLDLQEDILLSHGRKDWRAAMAVLRVHRPDVWDRKKTAPSITHDDAERVDPWELIDHVEIEDTNDEGGPEGGSDFASILAGLSKETGEAFDADLAEGGFADRFDGEDADFEE